MRADLMVCTTTRGQLTHVTRDGVRTACGKVVDEVRGPRLGAYVSCHAACRRA